MNITSESCYFRLAGGRGSVTFRILRYCSREHLWYKRHLMGDFQFLSTARKITMLALQKHFGAVFGCCSKADVSSVHG